MNQKDVRKRTRRRSRQPPLWGSFRERERMDTLGLTAQQRGGRSHVQVFAPNPASHWGARHTYRAGSCASLLLSLQGEPLSPWGRSLSSTARGLEKHPHPALPHGVRRTSEGADSLQKEDRAPLTGRWALASRSGLAYLAALKRRCFPSFSSVGAPFTTSPVYGGPSLTSGPAVAPRCRRAGRRGRAGGRWTAPTASRPSW